MLLIREQQRHLFDERAMNDFLDRMVVHIRREFPTHYQKLEAEGSRELVEIGIERAARHGFVTERNVCKFVNLMLCFGVEFDEDPNQTWVAPVLYNYRNAPRNAAINALYDAAMETAKARAASEAIEKS